MICRDIWHKCHEWYFEIVIRNFKFETIWNIASGIYAKYHIQIMILFVSKRFVIFTHRYFKLSWNTTLSQSNCRNFSRSNKNMLTVSPGVNVLYFNMTVIANTTRTHKRLTVKISNTKKAGEKSVYPQRSKVCQTKIELVTAGNYTASNG